MFSPRVALPLALVLLASSVAAQTRNPHHVRVVGTDYAFVQFPAMLPPGETVFSFENRGSVRHEVNVRLLKPGVTVEQAMRAAVEGGGSAGALVERMVGVLLAAPGDSAGGRLLVHLLPGRSYGVVCILRDAADAPMHTALGMVGGFRVGEAAPNR